MTRTECWAIKTRQGNFVHLPVTNFVFEGYRIMTFRTRKAAQQWLDNDRYWKDKSTVVPITITTKERGEI